MEYKTTVAGTQQIIWNKQHGKPLIDKNKAFEATIAETDKNYLISVAVKHDDVLVEIKK